jgi:hypothetical protein
MADGTDGTASAVFLTPATSMLSIVWDDDELDGRAMDVADLRPADVTLLVTATTSSSCLRVRRARRISMIGSRSDSIRSIARCICRARISSDGVSANHALGGQAAPSSPIVATATTRRRPRRSRPTRPVLPAAHKESSDPSSKPRGPLRSAESQQPNSKATEFQRSGAPNERYGTSCPVKSKGPHNGRGATR